MSEIILERELNLAHVCHGGANLAEARRRGSRRILIPPISIRGTPLHMIRSVEHLHPELEGLSFSDPEILDERDVEVHLSRADQIVARASAVLSRQGVGE